MPAFCLSLGSNVGAREANLLAALEALAAAGLPLSRVSSIYETEPIGEAAGPGWFLNLAARGETEFSAHRILEIAAGVEQGLGRTRKGCGGPRTIDVDLLLLGDTIVNEPGCEVPHPRLHERRFVLEPLAEIAPEARHPLLGLTVRQMLDRLADPSCVRRSGGLREAV